MNPSSFAPDAPGQLVSIASASGKSAWAFVPSPLPPDLIADHGISEATARATLALGNLNGVGQMLRNPNLLIRPFVQREALASSRIEGTKADYGQLVLLEASDDEMAESEDPDLQEVANYTRTLFSGWHRPTDRPFSTGFLMELHSQLLDGVRGSEMNPGRLRSIQVLVGTQNDDTSSARFVPPPPEMVRGLLDDFCLYVVSDRQYASLVRLALIHYQFETIHPFMDGNGRLGRLLLPLTLGLWGELDLPLLYLSEYIEDHRDEYIEHLFNVSSKGDWRSWILFMLEAIERQAKESYLRIRELNDLREELRHRYQERTSGKTIQMIDQLFDKPSLTVKSTAKILNVAIPTATRIVDELVKDGVIEEITGRKRDRVFISRPIMDVMFARVSTT